MDRVDQMMQRAVDQGLFPAACLLVAHEGQPVLHRAWGQPGQIDTVFDLASLTKVLATTTVTMQLVARGDLDPDDPVSRWLPEIDRPEMRRMRLSHLLGHCSGLPAWLPLYQHPRVLAATASRRRDVVRRLVATTPLAYRTGRDTRYSDLGFILLDWVLQRCGKQRLDRLAEALVFRPLGLSRTRFVDLLRPDLAPQLRRRWPIAPTERTPWRGRRLVAKVHDDNCAVMGGIAGHAGLFSTTHDIHLITRELVAAYHNERSLFDPAVVRLFFTRRPRRAETRVLGWDTPGPRSSAGRYFGPRSVGHLGFTGTSLWIDLPRRVWVILLTNRVYHGREPNPMRWLRPRLHDAIMRRWSTR